MVAAEGGGCAEPPRSSRLEFLVKYERTVFFLMFLLPQGIKHSSIAAFDSLQLFPIFLSGAAAAFVNPHDNVAL